MTQGTCSPETAVNPSLDTALSDFCSGVYQHSSLKIAYQSMGIRNTVLDDLTSISIYRTVQELINNALQHADARLAVVQVYKTGNKIAVTFDADSHKGKGTSVFIEFDTQWQ
jgi:two-component system, NarL family, sensor kinase